MERRVRRDLAVLALVLGVGLLLRVAYIVGQRRDVLFDYPVVDEERYVAMARALAEGHTADPRPWFHPPGLVYALSAVFRLFGPGLLAPRLVQALVSTASCGAAFLLARRLFSTPIALGTAAICAVHGVLVFEAYELLPPTWILASDLVALLLLVRAGELRTPKAAGAAGLAFGVSALFGPTVLPFAAVAALWLRRPALVFAFVGGLVLPIAPVTYGNWQRGHELVLVSTNGGINFYIGNNERYEQTLAIRPGAHWDELMSEPSRAGVSGWGAASSYFTSKGLAFWRAHPLEASALYARKLYLYFDGPEIPRDTDLQAMRHDSAILRALVWRGPPWVPDGVLVPLALLGAVACWRDRRKLLVPYAFVAEQALVTAAFFVTSRYRVPALPVLAMFACAGAARIVDAWRGAEGVRRVIPAAAAVAMAVPLNVSTRESSVTYAAEADFYRGLARRTYLHDPAGAVDDFRRATREDGGDARFWFELGNTLDTLRQQDEAVEAWRKAAELDPSDRRPRHRVAFVLAQRGDLDGAIGALQAGLLARGGSDDSSSAADHLDLFVLLARAHRYDTAVDELGAAKRADRGYVDGQIAGIVRAMLADASIEDPVFWRAVADACRELRSRDAAERAARRAEALAPSR
ncbi:MAG TPA: glycosyltransferase family 39 protein [Polyangiaceae bacterium]|nr:glycosyltransferase family 39 protein [Polyangiaceae bacterium]